MVVIAWLLAVAPAVAEAQARQSILVRVEDGFITNGCGVDTFAATGPGQSHSGGTMCVLGGPFGAGMIGTTVSAIPKFSGNSGTIQLNRTFSFNNGRDTLSVRTVFNFTDKIFAGPVGGFNHFNGTWEITGGTGAFAGLNGQGTLTNDIGSDANVPPPPEFQREEWVGWVSH
jgi:hypothetical protein